MKYRKKPIVIDAEQWFPDKYIDGVSYPLQHAKTPMMVMLGVETLEIGMINTLEGPHIVTPGDWVITGVKGEKYPCKPDIFEQTYEQVEE